jgi:hypothetical protein
MTTFKKADELEVHKKLARDLFNYVWDLMEKTDRSSQDEDTMIHAAHASRFHWGIAGTPLHFARGEWQISRVYSILKRFEPALYHAKRCVDLCLEHDLGNFDLAYGYEAMARAFTIQGDSEQSRIYLQLATEIGEKIENQKDKNLLFADLANLKL